MQRCIEPEWLDELPAQDPRAVQSREDLLRLNAWMGNAAILARALRGACNGHPPRRIIELGAGDGRFALRAARRLARNWPEVSVTLLDRQELVTAETAAAFAALGWRGETVTADVLERLQEPTAQSGDWLTANLFLHHFSANQLAGLFCDAAMRACVFVAVEPRRSAFVLTFSRCLWLIGCRAVTRHDAPASVRAGFVGRELSQLWPKDSGWSLEERPAGLFSHLFVARRVAGFNSLSSS